MKKVYLVLAFIFALSLGAHAGSHRTIASGSYGDEGIWDNNNGYNGKPGTNITNNDVVIIDHNVDFGNLKITNGGNFIINAEVTGLKIEFPGGLGKGSITIGSGGMLSTVEAIDPLGNIKIADGSEVCSKTIDGKVYYGSCNGTLPVNLLYFAAKSQNQSVEINWASSKAWDFSHFELERSANGTTFEYVATIDAAEFSNETVEYAYSDRQPLFGTSYYRLKAVDVDGSFEYKEMTAVKFGAESYKVYPNPAADGFIYVDWSHATEGGTLSLTDNTGRVVRTLAVNGHKNVLSTQGLTAGMYVLSIQSPAGSKHSQVVVR